MSHHVLLAGPKMQQIAPYADFLSQRGYEVRTASTGLACLTVLRRWRPDLLVMNPDMCWGSGFGVLGVMHEDPSIPMIPVVLLVDDRASMKSELRPEWKCRMLRGAVSPLYLTEIMDELLHQPISLSSR